MALRGRLWEFLLPLVLLGNHQIFAGEPEPTTAGRPIVLIVGGVGGLENLKLGTQWALKHAGLDCEVRNFEWTHGKGHILKDLQDTRQHARKTAELVDEIRKIKESDPDRPLYIIGRSG